MSIEQALAEAYASANSETGVVFDTFELRHPAFVDDAGQPTAIRFVLGYENITVRLEDDAPLNGGEYVEFVAGAYRFTLPGFEEGRVPELKISLDGVTREVVGHIEAASAYAAPIEGTYRPYVETDLSKPAMDPPFNMTLKSVVATGTEISATGSMEDVFNWPFPSEKYVLSRFPGLLR